MVGLTLLQDAEAVGLGVSLEGDELIVTGPRKTEPVAKLILASKRAVIEAIRLLASAHSDTSDPDAQACKRCGRPIVWGEVVETLGKCDDPRRWIPLDPDLFPHGCRRGQRDDGTEAATP